MTNRCPKPSCLMYNRVVPNQLDVCGLCGTSLNTANESQNSLISEEQFLSSQPSENSSRPQLRLSHPNGKNFDLPGEEGNLGRRNFNSGEVPEIDLSGIPHERIVSRSHARIYWDRLHQTYMIFDRSHNGTCLNNIKLKSHAPYPLKDQDELQLGDVGLVYLKVSILTSSPA